MIRPDVPALVRRLAEHHVHYVITGSMAALLHGIELEPGDLDIAPATDAYNLRRLAAVLDEDIPVNVAGIDDLLAAIPSPTPAKHVARVRALRGLRNAP